MLCGDTKPLKIFRDFIRNFIFSWWSPLVKDPKIFELVLLENTPPHSISCYVNLNVEFLSLISHKPIIPIGNYIWKRLDWKFWMWGNLYGHKANQNASLDILAAKVTWSFAQLEFNLLLGYIQFSSYSHFSFLCSSPPFPIYSKFGVVCHLGFCQSMNLEFIYIPQSGLSRYFPKQMLFLMRNSNINH